MQRIFRFLLILASMMLLGMASLAAVSMTVEWEWLLDDPEVTAYRYQLGGEDPDGWIVVSADTSSYRASGLDPYQGYTLYVQRSYDGVNWSESAVSTASAMIPEGTEAILPEPEAAAEAEEPAAAEEAMQEVEAVPVEEETVPAEDVYVYSYGGYDLEIRIGDGYADLLYPSVVTESDAEAFFAHEMEKHGESVEGITYSFIDGGARLSLPESIDRETAKANADTIYQDIIAYIMQMSIAETDVQEEPVAEETAESDAEAEEEAESPEPEVVVIPEASEESPFAFSLLFRFGAGSRFSDAFAFQTPAAQFGIGLDFRNAIPVGRHFGFGLRSDITVDFMPKGGAWNLADNLQYFNVLNYAEASSIDLKITADVTSGPVDFYLGGGLGYSISNPADNVDNEYFNSIHTLGTVDIGTAFSSAWFASGILGVRFYCGDIFSIGAEVHYRYYMPSGKHYGSADLVLGFTF